MTDEDPVPDRQQRNRRIKPRESDFVGDREVPGWQFAAPIINAAIVMRRTGWLEIDPLVGAYRVGPLVRRARGVLRQHENPARAEDALHLVQYHRLVGDLDMVQNEQRPRRVECRIGERQTPTVATQRPTGMTAGPSRHPWRG